MRYSLIVSLFLAIVPVLGNEKRKDDSWSFVPYHDKGCKKGHELPEIKGNGEWGCVKFEDDNVLSVKPKFPDDGGPAAYFIHVYEREDCKGDPHDAGASRVGTTEPKCQDVLEVLYTGSNAKKVRAFKVCFDLTIQL